MDVASYGSWPAMVLSSTAQSFTSFVRGPAWSRDDANATMPYLETMPYVGFSPTTPQHDAGWRIEPPGCAPKDAAHSPASPLATEPPLEPPGTRSMSHGFFVTTNAEFSVDEPMANSSILFFPKITAPASLSFFMTVAS